MDTLQHQQMSQDAGCHLSFVVIVLFTSVFFKPTLEKWPDSECSISKHLSERKKGIRGDVHLIK